MTTSESAVFDMMRTSKHPRFKDLLTIIKGLGLDTFKDNWKKYKD